MSRALPRSSVFLAALASVAASLVGVVADVEPVGAYPSDTVQFDGHGWGHGRGLGQYGSLGYAVDEGQPYSAILDHYYGNSTKGTQPDGPITVRLTEFDNKGMIVSSAAAFAVDGTPFAANEAARVTKTAAGYELFRGPGCGGPWTTVTTLPATAQPTASVVADPGDDVRSMVRTCGPTGNLRSYRGTVKMVASGTSTWVVNTVAMEQYLRGVVPRESPASWGSSGGGKGMEALKAQSVAARSYAWAEQRSSLFKTCDTISCQVYGGAGLNGQRIESPNSDAAIAATAGEVRIIDGKPARTEFSSSTGGHTAGGTFKAVPDAGDDVAANPNHAWSTSVPVTKVQQAWPQLGTLQKIEVTKRNGLGANGGRSMTVVLTGTDGTVTTTGDQVRSKLGLKSDWFYVVDPTLNAPAVGVAVSGTGAVLASRAGEVMSIGGGVTYGSMEGKPLPKPIVAIATTPTGKGYWLAGSDGSIYRFGDAADVGSLRGKVVPSPIVGMAATKTGLGLYLVDGRGSVVTLGDAVFHGSMFGKPLNKPILGMTADPDGEGYWLLGGDGGVFSFKAPFYGSTGAMRLNQPIFAITADPMGGGYWFVASDGGVFTFPTSQGRFFGSAGGSKVPAPIVGMAATPTGKGYWLLGQDGAVYKYGDAT